MSQDAERDLFAQQLRDSLKRHAAEASGGELLAERIIQAAGQRSASSGDARRRGWRTWALPLIAAGAVAGAVLAVVGVVGVENHHQTTSPPADPASVSVVPTTSPAQTSAVSPSPTPSGAPGLTGVKILDVTFVSDDEGWALASADCEDGSGRRCPALLNTSDAKDWHSVASTPFNVPGANGCEYPCVANIRFANPDVGYVFGANAFFMTTNAGMSWTAESGGAVMMETLDQNVIRVTSPGSGCPSWCDVRVETSAIGSTTWTPAELGATAGFGVQLSRGGGHNAYLLFPGHIAGGAPHATSVLYRSADDGRTWAKSPEPCPQTTEEIDSTAIGAGTEDRVSVLCTPRPGSDRWFVATSTDAGAHFTAQPGLVPQAAADGLLAGDPNSVLVAASAGMARSTDGGKTWQTVSDVTGHVTFVGFESAKVARAITDNRTIWTTRDGGQTWTAAGFG
jgi:photosystem II stability/assembly factor-like uncharacterized protein